MSFPIWKPAYIGIGSNLDEPANQVMRAFEGLALLPKTKLVVKSKLYRSPPLGPPNQPEYVNAVAGLLTQLESIDLLMSLQELERKLGRAAPIVRWGPRVIDLDLLVVGSERIDNERLVLPHKGIAERAFVLVPLSEIAPDLSIPGLGKPSQLVQRVDCAGVVAL